VVAEVVTIRIAEAAVVENDYDFLFLNHIAS